MPFLLLLVFLLPACTTPPVKVDPTLLHSSYDYTRPAEIADQSKPVWVLPLINQGWVPAKVDPKTGDWISGHYTASVIQDGHWATLEEAELAGRPYVIAGEGKPVVPIPTAPSGPAQEVPATSITGGELDVAALDRRVSALEQKAAEGSDPKSDAGQARPEEAIYLPGRSNSGDYEIPLETTPGSPPEKLQVFYLPGNQVRIVYQGTTHEVHLDHPEDQIKIVLPKS
jgi:hypothetical protein